MTERKQPLRPARNKHGDPHIDLQQQDQHDHHAQHVTGQANANAGVNAGTNMLKINTDASIATQLAKLNTNMISLNTTMEEMRKENKEALKQQDSKLDRFEKTFNTKLAHYDESLTKVQVDSISNKSEIDELRATIAMQQQTIEELAMSFHDNTLKTDKEMLEMLQLANSIESHQRRWALRFLGIQAPAEDEIEKTEHAKLLVLDIITRVMDISGVTIHDIDCAHRVGEITDKGKQTMLVRFFARDLVQLILKTRTILKGSPFVVFEDMPVLSRRLLRSVKDNPKTESGWCQNGAIWAKPVGKFSQKLKFKLGDDVTRKLEIQIAKPNKRPPGRPPGPFPHSSRRQPGTFQHNSSTPRNQPNPIMHLSHSRVNSHISMTNATTSPKLLSTSQQPDSHRESTLTSDTETTV
jgi:hypothetical protein